MADANLKYYDFIAVEGLDDEEPAEGATDADLFECFQGISSGGETSVTAVAEAAEETPAEETPAESPWKQELLDWALDFIPGYSGDSDSGMRGLNAEGQDGRRSLLPVLYTGSKISSFLGIIKKYGGNEIADALKWFKDLVELINEIADLFGWGAEGELDAIRDVLEKIWIDMDRGDSDCCEQVIELLKKSFTINDGGESIFRRAFLHQGDENLSVLRDGLLYVDVDNRMRGAIPKAFVERRTDTVDGSPVDHVVSLPKDIAQMIDDLKYNTSAVELGHVRLLHNALGAFIAETG